MTTQECLPTRQSVSPQKHVYSQVTVEVDVEAKVEMEIEERGPQDSPLSRLFDSLLIPVIPWAVSSIGLAKATQFKRQRYVQTTLLLHVQAVAFIRTADPIFSVPVPLVEALLWTFERTVHTSSSSS